MSQPSAVPLPDLPHTPLGRYRHYKGGIYDVVGVARHSESLEPMVVYRPGGDPSGWWIRPHSMFFEWIDHAGTTVRRFERIETP